jgi:small-conductance mechanosensitive channel
VARIADSGVILSVAPWVNAPDYGAASSEINAAVLEAFRAAGIALPPPQREIRVVSSAAYVAGEASKERLSSRDAA